MKNIENICKDLGIEIPEDKAEAFHKEVTANYKAVTEYDKLTVKTSKLEEDLEAANETLEKFKDIDPEKINEEIANYKQQAEDAEKNYKAELEKRDYKDLIEKQLEGIKFSSEAAKRAFRNDLMENPLQVRNGALLGFDEVYKQAKETDPTAFVDEKKEQLEQGKAKFTTKLESGEGGSTGAKTKEEIMAIKDATERQAAIRENISLFTNTQ